MVSTFKLSERDRIRLELMKDAPLNQWIALLHDESRIVAASPDMIEVVELSRVAGESDPILVKTLPVWGEYATGFQEVR